MQTFPFQLPFDTGPAGGDVEAMRARLLEQVMWIMGFGLIISLLGGLDKALRMGLDPVWLPQAACMLGFLAVLLFGRGMSRRRRGLILLALLWVVVAFSVLRLGPVADSRGYMLVLVFLAMVFLGERAGWASLALVALVLGGMAVGVDAGLIGFSTDLNRYAALPVTWYQSLVGHLIYGGVVALGSARLVRELADTVAALRGREDELERALSLQRAVVENSGVGIALLDARRRFVQANASFGDLVGHDPEGLVGQSTRLLYPDQQRFAAHGRRIYERLARAPAEHGELQLVRGDGELVWCHYGISRLVPDDPDRGVIVAAVDISVRKAREAAMLRAKRAAEEADQAKERLLLYMGHELRTPLTAVVGLIDALRAEASSARQRELIGAVEHGGLTLLAMVDQALDLSRARLGRIQLKPRLTDVGALLLHNCNLFRPQAEAAGLILDLRLPTGLPPLLLDALRLSQILANLLRNAILCTPTGRIRVTASLRSAAGGAQDLAVVVCDTGVGIAAADRERVFERFERLRRDRGGSGLGLCISRELARRMGGTLTLASRAQRGSCFRLRLPGLESADAPPSGALAVPETPTASPPGPWDDPPPAGALAELSRLIAQGRASAIERWCRRWSEQPRYRPFAEAVRAEARRFDEAALGARIDACLRRGGPEAPGSGPRGAAD